MIKEIVALASILALAIAEAPLSGPYPPSGWKPKGAPFTLPKEFLPQTQAGGADVEVSKERVAFAGQLVETTTLQPNSGYLPPDQFDDSPEDSSTEDYLKVQGLPSSERRPFLQPQPQGGQLNTGEYNAPAEPSLNQYRVQNNRKFGQLRQQQNRQQQFGQNKQQQFGQLSPQTQQFGQFNGQPQQQFGQLKQQPQQFNPQQQQFNTQPQQFNPQPRQFNTQPQQFNPQPEQQFNPQSQQFSPQPQQKFSPQSQFGNQGTPAQEYGPPTPNPDAEEGDEADDTTDASAEDSQEDNQPAVAVANSISNGRYYVLTPDNTLQRVVFMTTQDKEEARTNGFTAQLRYMPVEPIRDPIYTYNEQGQLIRIFKK